MTFVWPEGFPSKTPRGTVSPLVTELRDVFPTMLDAAGAMDTVPQGHKIDGTSLLCLLDDASGSACRWTGTGKGENATGGKGWRPYLDLEHTTCYNASNHWSALTDGKMKYIFNADPTQSVLPKEQLFNLTVRRLPCALLLLLPRPPPLCCRCVCVCVWHGAVSLFRI